MAYGYPTNPEDYLPAQPSGSLLFDDIPDEDLLAEGFTQDVIDEAKGRAVSAGRQPGSAPTAAGPQAATPQTDDVDQWMQAMASPRQATQPMPSPAAQQGLAQQAVGVSSAASSNAADQIKATREASEKREQAMRDAAEIGEQRAMEEAAYMRRQRAEIDAENARDAAARVEQQKAVASQREKIGNMVSSLRSKKLDPDRFFKNEQGETDYGRKVIASIAVALGAFGAALTGGRNSAMDIINAKIDRDLDAQRQEIDSAKGEVDAQSNILQYMRQDFSDAESGRRAAKIALLERHKMQLDELRTEYMAPEQAAKLDEMGAMLQAEQAKEEAAITDRALAIKMQELSYRAQLEQIRAGSASAQRQLGAGEAKRVSEIDTALARIVDLNKSYKEKVSGANFLNFGVIGQEGRYDVDRMTAAEVIAKAVGGDNPKGDDIDRYYEMLPSPWDTDATKDAKIDAMTNLLNQTKHDFVRGLSEAGFDTGRARK